jgi:glutaredoxin
MANHSMPTGPVLYHDGCSICRSIAEAFESVSGLAIEIVNLRVDEHRAREAQAAGVTRLPSLVIGGKVMRLEDHSLIEHVM